MAKLKCYLCGKVFDEKKLIYTKDPDELMCPICGEREPGFSEIKDEEKTRLTKKQFEDFYDSGYLGV